VARAEGLRALGGAAMKRWMLVLVGLGLALCVGGASYAVPPAYCGELGNPEEPALRPYKAFFQGLRALFDRSHEALREGNTKMPVIGSVEVVRGMRRGAIDCVEYTYRSVAGSLPPRADEYKKAGSVNKYIDEDRDVTALVDFVSCGGVLFPVVKVVDNHAVKNETKVAARRDEFDQKRAARKEAAAKKVAALTEKERLEKCQEQYLGERATSIRPKHKKDPYKGNILKLAR
jgi:hypothetical protein